MRIAAPSTIGFGVGLAVILGGGAGAIGAQVSPWGWLLGPVAALLVLMTTVRRPWRRWRAVQQPFPEAWRTWLIDHVPVYRAATPADRRRFENDIRLFLLENRFEAVGGVEVTEALKLQVAAGAALLLHGLPDWELSTRRTILIYPDRFDDAYYDTDDADFDGMVHEQGPMILSAPAIKESWSRPGWGSNVVLHELAHFLDYANEFADGVPALIGAGSEEAWRQLVRREMQYVRIGKSVLRRYAATDPAEFFAVAVENFFDRPHVLERRHPELYEVLVTLFNQDPNVEDLVDEAEGADVSHRAQTSEGAPRMERPHEPGG